MDRLNHGISSKLQNLFTPLVFLSILSSISTNRVSVLSFPTTGSENLCFVTDPSLYVSDKPLRGSARIGVSSLSQTTWTGHTSMCLKSASGSGKSLAILQSLNRIVESVDLDNSNYDVGNIGKGSSQQFPTTGALLVYLIGSGFGVYHLSPTSNFGLGKILSRAQPMQLNSYLESTSSASTLWRSDSSTFF